MEHATIKIHVLPSKAKPFAYPQAEGDGYPIDPHIGFLVKHHAVAVELMERQRSVPQCLPRTPKPTIPYQAPVVVVEKPHRLTAEEFEQLMAGLSKP